MSSLLRHLKAANAYVNILQVYEGKVQQKSASCYSESEYSTRAIMVEPSGTQDVEKDLNDQLRRISTH